MFAVGDIGEKNTNFTRRGEDVDTKPLLKAWRADYNMGCFIAGGCQQAVMVKGRSHQLWESFPEIFADDFFPCSLHQLRCLVTEVRNAPLLIEGDKCLADMLYILRS